MKVIFNLLIAVNFLINGGQAWGTKTSDRVAHLKARIEQLENNPGTLKEIQALQREIDDIEHTPKMPEFTPNSDTPFIDGGQQSQTPEPHITNPGNIDIFNENTNLVAVDYGVPKEIVERAKSQLEPSDKGQPDSLEGRSQPKETALNPAKEEIRKKRENIHATRGIMGKRLKIPKKASVLQPGKPFVKQAEPRVEKPMHGRPTLFPKKQPANMGPSISSILPVSTPGTPVARDASKQSGWGFCENDVPYLQEQLEIKISQLSHTQDAIKRTKDGFEVQKLANEIQQLENDKQYYIKMIQSLGGTPKIQKSQRSVAAATVPTQSQEYQIKSTLERLAQAEKMVRHRVRITKDPKALSALGASLENIQQQRKLLEASAKDKGAMDKTEVYESPEVFVKKESVKAPVQHGPLQNNRKAARQAPPNQIPPNQTPPKNEWASITRHVTNPSDIEGDYIDDDDVIKSAPQKPLWSDAREPIHEERPTRTQTKGRPISKSEAQQIAKAWLSR